ncbi:Crp/Fnr family transcriptional regulator [Actinoplanes sp. TFC3]|uniref:Crp/Fnr family transcriptional regulator n=1 Tax=Actinoplanes sp. TFC3 TaxID=1710355 RepID=UPI00082A1AD4|nr:Crp/Fnr family transcriptional regulator [Actinoplanes sp. TFC3]
MTTDQWAPGTFLGRLSKPERTGLFQLGRREEFRDGSFLLRQGDESRDVLVLLTGRVRIVMAGADRPAQRIAVRASGELLGELGFLDNRLRSASVVAVGLVSGLRLPRDAFSRFLDNHPGVLWHVARLLSERLRAADARQMESALDVEARLAAALFSMALTERERRPGPVVVRCTQRELGQMIGAATVSVHRALRKLAGRDCITTGHRAVVIRDLDALAEVAGRTTLHHLT